MSLRRTLSELAAFLRKPTVLRGRGLRAPGAWRLWTTLTVFQILVLCAVVVQAMLLWQKAFGLPSPDAFDGMSPLALWGGAVILAPVLEELFFRAWLGGRPRALAALAVTVAGLAAFVALGRGKPLIGLPILAATALAACVLWLKLRRREDIPPRFASAFPAIFYGTVLVFAALHLANYPQVSLLALPMVLPQAWTGVMLGYIRVRIGLVAAILTHVASNAVVLSLALATGT